MCDWQCFGYDEIVCYCEMVICWEIFVVLEGLLLVGDFGGLKCCICVCMGCCQGFYCNVWVVELSVGCFVQFFVIGSCYEYY